MSLINLLKSSIGKLETTYDVDTTDRIKYSYTPWIMGTFAFLTFAKEYVGQSVQCWVPSQFSGGWEQYAETYCLIEGSYFHSMNETNLPSLGQRENAKIRYYQWVPFILLFQIIVLYTPRLLWKQLQKYFDFNLGTVTVDARKNARGLKKGHFFLNNPQAYSIPDVWFKGNRLTMSLLISKIVSIVVVFLLTLNMEWFLSGKCFNLFGLNVMWDIFHGKPWQESGNFPRVTFCDFEVRELGNVQRWSLQCVLMVNLFNEKIFIFLWFWFAFLVILSLFNLAGWIWLIIPSNQLNFLKQLLEVSGKDFYEKDLLNIQQHVLKTDGTTVLALINENSNIYETSKYFETIWNKEDENKKK